MKTQSFRKKIGAILIFAIVILAASAFNPGPPIQDNERNLEVLPHDISDDELTAVMQSFEVALSMGCNDCHAKSEKDPTKLDFKSDDHPNKNITRYMMRMTAEINEQYFDVDGDFKDNYLYQEYPVTCNTCHNGHARPVYRISVPINYSELER